MTGFQKIIAIVKYFADALSAISKGIEVASNNWPTDNPFSSGPEKTVDVDTPGEIPPAQ